MFSLLENSLAFAEYIFAQRRLSLSKAAFMHCVQAG
jgi:hypothetical protein